MPSLKQTGSQASWHRTMLIVYVMKSCQQSSLPWILLVQNRLSRASINQQVTLTYWISSKSCAEFLRNRHKSVWCLKQLWPWMKVMVILTAIKMKNIIVPITISSFKEIDLSMSQYKQILIVLVNKIILSRVLSFEYWLNKQEVHYTKKSQQFKHILSKNSVR